MYVKEFADRIATMADDIGCDGNGGIGSHLKVRSKIFIDCINEDDDLIDYEIVDLDIDVLPGCQCPSGIIIKIKKIKMD